MSRAENRTRNLYSRAKAAERLDFDVRTIDRWIADGRLPVIRIGRSVRINGADLERIATTGTPAVRNGGNPK